MSELMTARDVAKALKVSERQIWKLAGAARMPRPLRFGRSVRWRADEIDGWLKAGCPADEATTTGAEAERSGKAGRP